MASAHGAGLMILPVLMAQPMLSHSMAAGMPAIPSSLNAFVIGVAVLIHTVSMLAVAGILAVLFFETYEKAGLQLLRRAWLNFDLLWAIALLVAGFATLFF
jgi:cation transport ATPase